VGEPPYGPGPVGNASTLDAGAPTKVDLDKRDGVAPVDGQAEWLTWLKHKIATDRMAVMVVVGMGALLFLPFLGTLGLWDPWETHYGEVARAMIARDDYVYPYWESAYFFSKPAMTLWLIAFGLFITGAEGGAPTDALGSWAEWGVRLPFAAIAILALYAVYRIATQLRDRTTGVIAAFVLGSCPQFIFIGKQAMADMPLVGFLTFGMAMFCAAVFDQEEDAKASPRLRAITAIGIAVAVIPQLLLIGRELEQGMAIAACAVAGVVGVGYVAFAGLWASRRECWILGFYTAVGCAALAKGLAVLAVVGPVVILYMAFTLDWRILIRAKLVLGAPLFLLVALPWYLTLSLFTGRDDEGLTFNERFWEHDNFGRVGSGVHGDRGGVGYYLEQLAYGMFPWVALVPMSIGFAAKHVHDETNEQKKRLLVFVLIWALWVYVFFTMSQTKFHHYTFPAVPGLAILVAVWFAWLAENPAQRLHRAMGFVILAIFAVAARDLINDPQNLVNLFTYKYDRDYPREVVVRPFLGTIVGVGSGFMVIFYLLRKKGHTLGAFLAMAIVFGAWISHHHFNMLSPHWSQAHLFKTYYEERQGNEPIYAYQLNWRGETFYSRNRVVQVKEKGANERMRQVVDQPGREFIITEQSRFQTLKGLLSADKRDKLEIIDRSSNKFYLCVVGD